MLLQSVMQNITSKKALVFQVFKEKNDVEKICVTKLVSWPGESKGDSTGGAGDRGRRGRRSANDSGVAGGGEDGGDRKEDEDESGNGDEDSEDADDEDADEEEDDNDEDEDDDDTELELELLEDDSDTDEDDSDDNIDDSHSILLVDSESDSSELQLWPQDRSSPRNGIKKNIDVDSDTNFPAAVYSRDTLRAPGALTLVSSRGRTVWLGPAGRTLRRHVRRSNVERNLTRSSRPSAGLPVSALDGEAQLSRRRSGLTQLSQVEKCASSTDARDSPTSESGVQDTSEECDDTSDSSDTNSSGDSSEDAVDEDTALELRLRSVFFN